MYYACGCSLEWKGHAGVRRGRNTLYVRLFMPCIFKMSQKSFNIFCVKDHQLVKSRLGICNMYVVACWNGKGAQSPGVRRGRYMQLFMPCIYTIYIYGIGTIGLV